MWKKSDFLVFSIIRLQKNKNEKNSSFQIFGILIYLAWFGNEKYRCMLKCFFKLLYLVYSQNWVNLLMESGWSSLWLHLDPQKNTVPHSYSRNLCHDSSQPLHFWISAEELAANLHTFSGELEVPASSSNHISRSLACV